MIFTIDNGGDSPGRFIQKAINPFGQGANADFYKVVSVYAPLAPPGKLNPAAKQTMYRHSGFHAQHVNWQALKHLILPDEFLTCQPCWDNLSKKHDHLYFEFHEQGGAKQAVIKEELETYSLRCEKPEKNPGGVVQP